MFYNSSCQAGGAFNGRETQSRGSCSFCGGTEARPDRHMKMRGRFLAVLIRSFDPHQVIARPGKPMLRHSVAVLCKRVHVAVRFDRDRPAAVSEVVRLPTNPQALPSLQ